MSYPDAFRAASWAGTSDFPNLKLEHSAYMHRQCCRAYWTTYRCRRGADHSPSSTDHNAVCESPPLTPAEPCHWCHLLHLTGSLLHVRLSAGSTPGCRAQGVPIPSPLLTQNPPTDRAEPMGTPVSHPDTPSEKKFGKALQEDKNLWNR